MQFRKVDAKAHEELQKRQGRYKLEEFNLTIIQDRCTQNIIRCNCISIILVHHIFGKNTTICKPQTRKKEEVYAKDKAGCI